MKKFKILYIAAVASLLAACANEEDGIGNSSPVAATIQANISKTVTRATVGNTWSVSIRPTTGIKPLYTTIATVTMNLIVSAAIVLLNPYVT
uniref:hypothetical protein n=1 Tax=Phocaeicola plebeius TaxID=310297 RepID=UPI003FD7C82C